MIHALTRERFVPWIARCRYPVRSCMMMTNWLQKLFTRQHRSRARRQRQDTRSKATVRLQLEPLENRVLPAFNLAVAGADVAVSIVDAAGVRTITATGTGATVNVATI